MVFLVRYSPQQGQWCFRTGFFFRGITAALPCQCFSHSFGQHCFVTTMPRGSKIHPDIHYIVIRLSSIMKPEDIAIYTGISKPSVHRILRHFSLYGTIEDKKERKKKGAHLRDMDLEASNSAFSPYNQLLTILSSSLGPFVRTRTCIWTSFKRCCL